MSTLLASPRLAFLKKDSYMTRLIIVFVLLLIFFAAVRPGPSSPCAPGSRWPSNSRIRPP